MSNAREWTGYAESVEEALKRGLKKLGLTRDDVQMDILSERTSALFSMMDYRRVRVKLTAKPGVQPAVRAPRPDDKRRRDERPGRRPERDRNFNDRRDRNPQRGEERRRDQKPFGGSRDRRQENQDRQRNKQTRDQNRPPQNRFPENRRPNPEFRDRQRQGNPNVQRPQPAPPVQPPQTQPESVLPSAEELNRPLPLNAPEQISAPSEQSPGQEPVSQNIPATPRQGSPQPFAAPDVEAHLARWKELLGWEDLAWSVKPSEGHQLPVQLSTANSERLMGTRGETLEAFEYLFNLVLTQSAKDAPTVQFGMEGFENPKAQRIVDLAKRAAAEVRRSRSVYRMDPMPPADRKIVHQALANEPDVETVSEGEGPFRKVVVRLKPGAAAPVKPSPWKR